MTTVTISQGRVALDDPHACTDANDILTVFGALFDTLVRRTPGGGYCPALATEWTVSEDARRYHFLLREGVVFHDGDPCEADAIRYALMRMARPDMGATLGAPGVYAQYLAGLEVEVLGRHEIALTLAQPIADLFDILAYGHVVSPRAVEAAGEDLARRAVGTGPYRLQSYLPGERIELRANPGHFDGKPTHDGIVWVKGETAAGRAEALRTGQVDIANGLPRAALSELPSSSFTTVEFLAPTALIMMFNAAEGPAGDPRVRLALNLAINRRQLVEGVLEGAGQPLHGFVSPVHYGADPNAPPFVQDLAEARRLLAEAGHPDGLTLQLYCPTRLPDEAQALADAIEAQLAPLGVRFERDIEPDRVRYANQVRLKAIHDVCVFDSSPMSVFRVLHEKVDSRVRGSWWQGYSNPAVERLIDLARVTTSNAAREELYRQCYRLLQQDPPWLYLYNHRRVIGLRGRHPDWRMRSDGVVDVRALPAF
ncbi:ABC transporter substrate-binding protein [Alsobacter sp. KACC 23698]|uniref:ABC transporter substrate-binding protein n=1 Tax=Alsobacter sp. KACC 23698 TaxID=3149229 RepID=A0AAU7JKZ4_9HYPH